MHTKDEAFMLALTRIGVKMLEKDATFKILAVFVEQCRQEFFLSPEDTRRLAEMIFAHFKDTFTNGNGGG